MYPRKIYTELEAQITVLTGMTGLKKGRLVGRYAVPNFENYIWGGEIRQWNAGDPGLK